MLIIPGLAVNVAHIDEAPVDEVAEINSSHTILCIRLQSIPLCRSAYAFNASKTESMYPASAEPKMPKLFISIVSASLASNITRGYKAVANADRAENIVE